MWRNGFWRLLLQKPKKTKKILPLSMRKLLLLLVYIRNLSTNTRDSRNDVYQIISSLMYIPPGPDHSSSHSFNIQQIAGEDTVEPNDPILQVANLAIWAEVNCTKFRRFITVSPTPISNADTFQVVSSLPPSPSFMKKKKPT